MSSSSSLPKPVEETKDIDKEKEKQRRLAIIATLVAPPEFEGYPDGGILTEAVKENKQANLNVGIKLLYLERAVTQDCKAFNESLDKLYDPELKDEQKEENIDLIRQLKKINDLCFNNLVSCTRDTAVVDTAEGATAEWKYLSEPALNNLFDNPEITRRGLIPLDPVFQVTIRDMVMESIRLIREQYEKKENVIAGQKAVRIADEASIAPQTGWRVLLDLPVEQQFMPFEAPLPGAPGAPPEYEVSELGSENGDGLAPLELADGAGEGAHSPFAGVFEFWADDHAGLHPASPISGSLSADDSYDWVSGGDDYSALNSLAAPPSPASSLVAAGLFSSPAIPMPLPTVEQLQALLTGVPLEDSQRLRGRAMQAVETAALIFNTPDLRARLWSNVPEQDVATLRSIVSAGIGQANLVFNDADLRARFLFGNEVTVQQTLMNTANDSVEHANLIFNNPDLRARLLVGDENNISQILRNIMCAQHTLYDSNVIANFIINNPDLRARLLAGDPQHVRDELDAIIGTFAGDPLSLEIVAFCEQNRPNVLPQP